LAKVWTARVWRPGVRVERDGAALAGGLRVLARCGGWRVAAGQVGRWYGLR